MKTVTLTYTRRIPKRALARTIVPFGKERTHHLRGVEDPRGSACMELCDSNGEYAADRKERERKKLEEEEAAASLEKKIISRFGRREGDEDLAPIGGNVSLSTNPYHQVHNPEYRKSMESKKTFLRVENLSDEIEDIELYAIFSRYGPLQIIYMPRDRDQNKKGFAIIGYVHAKDALVAIEQIDRVPWKNQVLHVEPIL